ncbi:MAG: nucleoside deaminase [Chloroflexi bacterium CFX1]|nr:nucleoside deaminase [Chloroflexi bacterium CFX1]MCK6566153.1 nucleoside deaminase [Anaerolineales bacterium]MCQ3952752.1 hypothetical protein [Chloroflexota bacterium]MDL1919773.1 nucleoside deaminase [Chloroflexi bacterium CFX5]NUQ58901.1 nucleoside deaminase [Anaerolineales bacterium]
MWETLSPPWQAALGMAWEAYTSGTVPIGAVVADAHGNIVARGRNRITESSAPGKQIFGDTLAHAEVNALLELTLDQEDRHSAALYSTMEPCPLCMGAFYMSSVRTLYYAARDPWAGSVDVLGKTPYFNSKPIKVFHPKNHALESVLVTLHTEWELASRGERILSSKYLEKFRAVHPRAVERGIELHRSGELEQIKMNSRSAEEFFTALLFRVQ